MNEALSGKEFDAAQVHPLAFFIDRKADYQRRFNDDTQQKFEMLQAIVRLANREGVSR